MMVIKNYEALRLMVQAKLLEQKEDWKNAQANQGQAFEILEKELRDYLGGIRHTVHVQMMGFGMGDVGGSIKMGFLGSVFGEKPEVAGFENIDFGKEQLDSLMENIKACPT